MPKQPSLSRAELARRLQQIQDTPRLDDGTPSPRGERWSPEKCASAIRVSLRTWQRYMAKNDKDRRVPDAEVLVAIREVFHVSIDWLLRPDSEDNLWLVDRDNVERHLATRSQRDPVWSMPVMAEIRSTSTVVTAAEADAIEERIDEHHESLSPRKRLGRGRKSRASGKSSP